MLVQKFYVVAILGLPRLYEAGWITTPDLTAVLRLAVQNEEVLDKAIFGNRIMSFWYKIKHALRSNTKKSSRRNIHNTMI